MTMALSRAEVERIAHLARLELTPAQVELYAGHMNNILELMDKLAEVDTTGVEPTYHAVGTTNAFREDVVVPGLTLAEALSNAPATDGQSILVPKVI
jgi:aspartyl-tRNA(Asn)/glutamyl-tRNA(Gln) amidotransferase subunit C